MEEHLQGYALVGPHLYRHHRLDASLAGLPRTKINNDSYSCQHFLGTHAVLNSKIFFFLFFNFVYFASVFCRSSHYSVVPFLRKVESWQLITCELSRKRVSQIVTETQNIKVKKDITYIKREAQMKSINSRIKK